MWRMFNLRFKLTQNLLSFKIGVRIVNIQGILKFIIDWI